MKVRHFSLSIFLCFVLLFSCSKSSDNTKKSTKQVTTEKPSQTETAKQKLEIGVINIPESKIGMGCITEYYVKGSNHKQMLYMQTGASEDEGWLSFLNIDGQLIEFKTKNEDTVEGNQEGSIITKFENEDYTVVIEAKIGEVHMESDAAEASGNIKVTDKKNNRTGYIEFEGGTAC